jgi:hypothetical protein
LGGYFGIGTLTFNTKREMKQTSVEFLMEKLFDPSTMVQEQMQWFEQAKQMERANIIDAYLTNPLEAKWKNIGTDYYNETFKTNEK